MDPVSLLLLALAKNPELAASAAATALKPGTVDLARMQDSFVDLSKGILNCYHRTAKFRQADVVDSPWERAGQYGAERSNILRIQFQGISTTSYEMVVAVMVKGNAVRTAVIRENSVIPYNRKCELEDWSSPK